MKYCPKCETSKPIDQFPVNRSRKDGRGSSCKVCQRKYVRSHYNENKKYYVEKARERNERTKKEARSWILSYLRENPCVDCGETDPVVLQFDHTDPSNKDKSICDLMRGYSLKRIKKEVNKCEVRCANCHTRRTAEQFDWWKN